MAIVEGILWVLFTLLCVIVSGIILLQEGKGGGLGEAFGGAGQQTFGVKAGGIARFTGLSATGLVVLALAISCIRSGSTVVDRFEPPPGVELPPVPAPLEPGASAPVPVQPGEPAPTGEAGGAEQPAGDAGEDGDG